MAYRESYAGKINRKLNKKLHVVEVASGRQKADLVLKNATYVNVFCNELSHGDIAVAEGLIAGMGEHYEGAVEVDMGGKLVLPGFVDAHIHLESALVSPKEFANAVIPHGTTTVITDPHEIANVMGTDGIEYMLQATEDLPVDVRFMLPSCVPATPLDESGAVLDYRAIDSFYEHNRVEGLAEMMNYVGVANADEQVLEKIVAAQAHHKKIDGHAPGLSGNDLNAYIAAGVYSDHECSTVEDAIAKLERGQYIMIREGTAARNLDALLPLLTPQYYTYCMFCTDDKHPNDLLEKGHIDYIVRRAIKSGVDPIIAVKCASHHAARYFLLNNRGAIAPGFLADFVVIDNFDDFNILEVYKKGKLMFDGKTVTPFEAPEIDPHLVKRSHETFHVAHLEATDFIESRPRAVLGMVPGEIVTTDNGYADHVDLEKDILKGSPSHNPQNHQRMVELRAEKVARVVDFIPEQEVLGDREGDLLVVGWGGTRGHLESAVKEMRAAGKKVSLCHFNYINPLPHGVYEIFSGFRKIVVCELNEGQFANYMRMSFPQFRYEQFNKVQGLPFTKEELVDKFNELLEK